MRESSAESCSDSFAAGKMCACAWYAESIVEHPKRLRYEPLRTHPCDLRCWAQVLTTLGISLCERSLRLSGLSIRADGFYHLAVGTKRTLAALLKADHCDIEPQNPCSGGLPAMTRCCFLFKFLLCRLLVGFFCVWGLAAKDWSSRAISK